MPYLANQLLRACRELDDPEAMATAHSMRAIVFLHLGEFDKVRTELSRAESLSQHPEILSCCRSNLALLCVVKESVEEGLRASDEAIRLAPQEPHAHFSRALLLGMKDETSAAVEELRLAIQAGGDSPTHQYFLATFLLRSGMDEEGMAGLRALEAQPHPGVFKHLASARLDVLKQDCESALTKIRILVLGIEEMDLSGFPGELYLREAEAIQAICARVQALDRFAGHLRAMSADQLRIYRESMRAPLGLSVDPQADDRHKSG